MGDLNIVYRRLDQIEHLPGNPKDHDMGSIIDSIQVFGFLDPLGLTTQDQTDFDGNGRLDALEAMRQEGMPVPNGVRVDADGMWMVPTVAGVDWLQGDSLMAAAIALNRTNERGGWTIPLLADALTNLAKAGALAGTGYDAEDLDAILEQLRGSKEEPPPQGEDPGAEEDKADELREKWGTDLDQLWELGDHRLICGDCTDPAIISRLMAGDQAHLVWTDPPWNVDYGGTDHPSWKKRSIQNDNLGDKFPEFIAKFTAAFKSLLIPGGMIYLKMSGQEWPNIDRALRDGGFHWSSTIIWSKDHAVLSRKDYHTRYEPIWYGWLDGAPRVCPLVDRTQNDVWDIPRPIRSEDHPTQTPLELVERCLKNSSRPGDTIVDLFLGSGTTLIASQRLQRTCRAAELDPRYIAVTIERWSVMTGLTPTLLEA